MYRRLWTCFQRRPLTRGMSHRNWLDWLGQSIRHQCWYLQVWRQLLVARFRWLWFFWRRLVRNDRRMTRQWYKVGLPWGMARFCRNYQGSWANGRQLDERLRLGLGLDGQYRWMKNRRSMVGRWITNARRCSMRSGKAWPCRFRHGWDLLQWKRQTANWHLGHLVTRSTMECPLMIH